MKFTIPQLRFPKGLFSFTLIAVLAVGAASVSHRAVAQESTPAASQTATPAASGDMNGLPAQPGQEKKEEQEEDNVYRHTALVQSLARSFHLPVETTARLFEWINAAIILLCIIIPLAKFMPRVFRQRRQNLSANLENARKTSADANARLSAVEAQMSRLDDEIAKIRAQVEAESKQDEARIKASIEEESARIVAAAEQEIQVAAAQARRGLRNFAADLAIEQATRQLVLTPETDRELIAEFVSDATGNGAAGKAGRN